MKKRFGMMVGSIALCALLLAGCGSSSSKSSSSSKESSSKISIMAPYMYSEPPASSSKVVKKLEKLTGTSIDFSWVANSSYEDKMNVTLASGDLPEIMVVQGKTSGFVKSAKAGAFWDLSDYLDDYKNLSKADTKIEAASSINGKTYGIYRRRDSMRTAVTLRKDWLEKLGLKEPETTEDLYNIAKAFTEDDPDGNGKNDTYGLILPKWTSLNNSSPYDIIALWFGASNAWGEDSKGGLTPSFTSEKYLEAMTWIKKMIDEGYVNQDFATVTQDDYLDYFIQGKGGITIDTYSTASNVVNKVGVEEAEKIVTQTGNLKGPDGKLRAYPTDGYSGMLAIPKSSVKTKADLKKVLTFIDKLSDKDVQVVLNNGLEGVNFEVGDDGYATALNADSTESKSIVNDCASLSQISVSVQGNEYYQSLSTDWQKQLYEKRQALMKSDLESAVYNLAAPYVSETYSSKGTTLDNIILDARVQYLAGQIDESGWKDAIDLWKKSGGSDVTSELSKLYKDSQ